MAREGRVQPIPRPRRSLPGRRPGSLLPIVLLLPALGAPASGAWAQTAPAGSPTGGATSTGGAGLEEIVVTATRQAQALSKVPESVTAFSQATLDAEGAKSIQDIVNLTPGVDFTAGGNNGYGTEISIRGIIQSFGSATTGIYIDDAPVQLRSNDNTFFGNTYPEIFDLDRVEVLRGPQGTLFGAGSEGGTVRFITPEPGLTNYSGYARVELADTVGGDPSYEMGAAVGGPIVRDELGFRVSAWYRRDGGWIDRVDPDTGAVVEPNSNYQDSGVVRAAVVYAASDALRITPSIYFQRIYNNDTNYYWEGLSNADDGVFRNGKLLQQPNWDSFALPAVKIEGDMGWAKIESLTSYFYRDARDFIDWSNFDAFAFTGSPFSTIPGFSASEFSVTRQNIVTQEVRLQSPDPDARLNWVAGIFYSDARQEDDAYVIDSFIPDFVCGSPNPSCLVAVFGYGFAYGKYSFVGTDTTHEEQVAGYGEVHYKVIDGLTLTVGLRVAKTDFSYYENLGGTIEGPFHARAGTEAETPVTPKVDLSYQLDDDNMVYALAAEGYRIGGINAAIPTTAACKENLAEIGLSAAPPSYQSDTLWNYEVGAKDKLFGGRLVLDASVFYDTWNNVQQLVALPGCLGIGFIGNLGTAVSEGFDLAAQARLTDSFTLTLSLGYTDSTYSKSIGVAPAIVVSQGNTLGGYPWVATLTGEYDFKAFNDNDAYFRAEYQFHRHNYGSIPQQNPGSISYDPAIPMPPDEQLVNLRAGVVWSGFDTSIFINNALNAHPSLTRYHDLAGDPLLMDLTVRPLTVGVTTTYRF